MTAREIPQDCIQRLARLLWERVGLRPATDGHVGIILAMRARLDALGLGDAGEYVRRLEGGAEDELRALLPLVTVGKTDFFRDANQFRALRLRVFPEIAERAREEGRPLAIWSAGCATGEEPYSLAMVACELGMRPEDLDLLATDVNPEAVERARAGRFHHRRLAVLDPLSLERFFVAAGQEHEARPELKRYVRFATHNLASREYPLPRSRGRWDLILCRNVIIYFDAETTARVVGNFYRTLLPGAFLCLGYSESLFRISSEFDLVELEGSFLYRKPEKPAPKPLPLLPEQFESRLRETLGALKNRDPSKGAAARPHEVHPGASTGAAAAASLPSARAAAPGPAQYLPAAPVARVGGALAPAAPARTLPTRSGSALPQPPAAGAATPQPSALPAAPASPAPGEAPPSAPVAREASEPPAGRRLPLAEAHDPIADVSRRLDSGDFDGALAALLRALQQSPGSVAIQITLGNVYTVMGRHEEAIASYRAVLATEPLCAEAHLFLGIACYEAGPSQESSSAQELSRALFLAPNLALAHYYLARLAERRGDVAAARRSYRNAIQASQGGHGSDLMIGYYPDLPTDASVVMRASQYALSALEETGG